MKSADLISDNRSVSGDVIWNMASFAVIAGIGILLHLLILKFFSTTALGIYAQVYSIHLIASQFATGGFHLSVQTYAPRYRSRVHLSVILRGAFVATFCQSLVVVGILFLIHGLIADLLRSPEVGQALLLVLPGLFFFSMNKVMLAFLNGIRWMKVYAIFRALRFIFMLAALFLMLVLDLPGEQCAIIISLAEGLLFVLLLLWVGKFLLIGQAKRTFRSWLLIHWRYGNKALIGNVILDVNAYVDVLMLGVFLSDAMVGVYSFASNLSEGVRQVNEVFRSNLNPILTQVYFSKRRGILQRLLVRSVRKYYKFLVAVSLVSVIGFPILTLVFQVTDEGHEMWKVFGILVSGVALASGYLPLKMIFNQVGMVNKQTHLFLWHFGINVVLNAIMIPILGIYGAAIATSLSMVAQVVVLKWMMRKHLSIRV